MACIIKHVGTHGRTETISARADLKASHGSARGEPGRIAPSARPPGRARHAGDSVARPPRAAPGENFRRLPATCLAAADEASSLPTLARALKDFLLDLRPAQNMLILKTPPSGAQPLAVVDAEHWKEVAGTLAGDDTVLVICSSRSGCSAVQKRVEEMLR